MFRVCGYKYKYILSGFQTFSENKCSFLKKVCKLFIFNTRYGTFVPTVWQILAYFCGVNMAQRLLARRNELKMSRERVAAIAQISDRTLQNYEKGDREPKASDLMALARALNTTVAYLIGEVDTPNPFNRLREAGIDPEPFKELEQSTIDRVLDTPGRAETSDQEAIELGLSLEEIEERIANARRLARQYVLIQELEKLKKKKLDEQKGNT